MTLKENGYSTAWFGKNHNVPVWEATPAGPFTNWPIGEGYDYFYGFVGGDTSQWQPGNLFRNTTPIHSYNSNHGWNMNTAIAEEVIEYINTQTATNPKRPWFIHYAAGATRHTIRPRSGWRRSARCTCLRTAGTPSQSAFSRTRRNSALFRRTPSCRHGR